MDGLPQPDPQRRLRPSGELPRFYAHNYQRFFHFAHHRHTKIAGQDPELLVQKPWTFWSYLKFVAGLALWIALIRNTVEHAFGHAPEPFLKKRSGAS